MFFLFSLASNISNSTILNDIRFFFQDLVYKLAHLFAKSLSYLQHNKLSQPFHGHSSSEHATNCGESWIFPKNVMKSETNFKLHNLRPFEEEIPSCKKEVKSEKKKEKQIQINKN